MQAEQYRNYAAKLLRIAHNTRSQLTKAELSALAQALLEMAERNSERVLIVPTATARTLRPST